MPYLSVLIPVYNGEHYLADALDSVLNQPCKDLEVIVADDGSTDRSLELAQSYARKDPRIHVLTHENYGLGKNRNDAMPHMRGTWSLFLDADDAILPGFYTEQMKALLGRCLERGIEVIVPARLHANEDLSKALFDRVPFDDVFAQGSDASWAIAYEFATMLYATGLLKREHILFSETRPEMESIFRHKAAFCAKRTLFTNDLWFAIRRDNPDQITQNWDTREVNRVRIQEMDKLARWHENRGTQGFVLEETRRRLEAAVQAQRAEEHPKSLVDKAKALLASRRDLKAARAFWAEHEQPLASFELDENRQLSIIEKVDALVTRRCEALDAESTDTNTTEEP